MKLSTSIFATLTLLAAGTANATLITAQDNFDGTSSGWQNGWKLAPATRGQPTPALFASATGNTALVIRGNANDAAVRMLAEHQDADVFVDFTLTHTGILDGNDFVGLWFGNHEGPSIGLKANCGITQAQSTCTNDLFVRMGGTGGDFLLKSNLTSGESYHLSGHLYKSGGSAYYNRFDAWFKPTAAQMTGLDTAVVTAKGTSNVKSFHTLGFRSANIDKNVTVAIDDLRVANVPEPGSLALMGLALAGLAAARRRPRG